MQEGKEILPYCYLCGMHMLERWIIKHHLKQRCNRNMHMRWWRGDVAIASRCAEASFSLTEEDEAECIKGVNNFKYLGRMLYRLDGDWPVVRRNVRKAHQVWIRLGKLLQMEGADSLV